MILELCEYSGIYKIKFQFRFHPSKKGFLIQVKKDANIQAKKADDLIKQKLKYHMEFNKKEVAGL